MLPGYRTRLFSDIEHWIGEGLISAEEAAAIRNRYPAQSDGVLVALIYVSGIFLSAGLIALVASNWQDIPRPVRVGGLLSLNAAIVAACAWLTQRKPVGSIAIEALAALSIVSAGASISLVGQMYHFPANWPAFGRSIVVIALATAVVARSTSALWLGAVALAWFLQAIGAEYGWRAMSNGPVWGPHSFEVASYCVALIALALSPSNLRGGRWTLLVVLLPGVWWVSIGPGWPAASKISAVAVPIIAIATLVLVQLGGKILTPQRLREALSALVGALLIVIMVLAAADGFAVPNGAVLGAPVLMSSGLVAACFLLINVRLNAGLWSDSGFWLAIALAACCVIGFNVPLKGQLAVLSWLTPLAALAIEARLSDRNKTFAAVIVIFLGLIVLQMGLVKDLRTFAAVLLASGVVAMAILLAVRKSSGITPAGSA